MAGFGRCRDDSNLCPNSADAEDRRRLWRVENVSRRFPGGLPHLVRISWCLVARPKRFELLTPRFVVLSRHIR